MTRFRSALLTLALLGCAAPAPSTPPLIRLSPAPASAFLPGPAGSPAGGQVFRQRVDPIETLGTDFVDFPALRLGQEETPAPAAPSAGPYQPLLDILRDFVDPGSWGPTDLLVEDGVLVARNSPTTLAALATALHTLREQRGRMIRSRVRLVTLRRDALSRFENIPVAGVGLVGTFDREQLNAAIRESTQGAALAAPSLTSLHGQKSHVMVLAQKSYIAGYDADGEAYQPVVGISTDGVVVELRSMANGDRPDEFLVSFEAQVATPSEAVEVRLAVGVLQLPAQGYARLSGRCAIRADQALLLVTRNPDPRNSERPILAMVVTVEWAD
ncbi:MAG TPA: hypothetical protein VNM14_00910 [Planctomycetota bacterium]|nr:hypothetical protein [Planctomycetota bacterium]